MLTAIYCLYFAIALTVDAYKGKAGWWKKFWKVLFGAVIITFLGMILQDARTDEVTVLAAGLGVGIGFAVLVGMTSGLACIIKPRNSGGIRRC